MKKFYGFVFAVLCMLFLVPASVEAAAPGKVTGLKQVGDSPTSIECEWNVVPGEGVRYEAAICIDGKNWVTKEHWSPTANEIKINSLQSGKTMQIKVRAYVRHWDTVSDSYVYEYGSYSSPIDIVTAPTGQVNNLKKVGASVTSLKFTWDKVPSANAYVVKYQCDSSKDTLKSVIVGSNSVSLTKLKKNSKYSVYVYGVRRSSAYTTAPGYNSYVSTYGVGVVPSKMSTVTIPYYWNNIGTVVFDAKRVVSADGYQLDVYTGYGKSAKVLSKISDNGPSITIKSSKFKKHNVLKVRVRGYTVANGKKMYGEWSDWKYFAQQPDIKSIKKKGSKSLRVSWDKLEGSTRYILYGSTKKDSGYKKIATTSKNYYDVSKVAGKSLKKNKLYYFTVKAQKKVGGKYITLAAKNARNCWYIAYK